MSFIIILSRFSYFVNIVVVCSVSKYTVVFLLLILIMLAGDVELNPGPRRSRQRQCRMMYANIRGLFKNIRDLTVASSQYDILLCS